MKLSRIQIRVLVASLVLAMFLLCARRASTASPTTKPAVVNPHWKAAACSECHDMSSGKASLIAVADTDAICLKCHDGKLASAEPHPTRRILKPNDEFVKPDGWPVVDDQIRCVTCHDTQFACDLKTHSREMNKNLLRGDPHASTESFCLNCHRQSAYQKLNPHLMAGNPSVSDPQCLVCHTKVLDRATTRPTGDQFLKSDQIAMCRDCHPRHRSTMTENHIGLHLSSEDLALMYARDTLGLASNPSKEYLASAAKAGARPAQLLPAKDDTITCSTCHNPHEAGVFKDDSQMSFAALQLDRQKMLVSPVRDKDWCRHCHAQ